MQLRTAVLHAGLLARKGEARPSAEGDGIFSSRAGNHSSSACVITRREPVASQPFEGEPPVMPGAMRRIELPRHLVHVPVPRRVEGGRRQVHARIGGELHFRLKIAAVRLGRTQQDLVAAAMDAYLSFLDEDVFLPRCGERNAGD